MQKITPYLWFDGVAAEAADFYASLFADGSRGATSYYPTEGLLPFQEPLAGKELTVEFTVGGLTIGGINAGPNFAINPAISFMVNFDPSVDPDADEHLRELWAALMDGGSFLMPLQDYPFSKLYGWVADRYGVNWQLILTDPAGEPRPHVMPALMFCGPAQNRCSQAQALYTSLFDDSRLGNVALYPQGNDTVTTESVMFSDFQLAGQWFVAMDSGVAQPFTFNEGVSLSVSCADQAEIDHFWSALSKVPEAEQCGWCKDDFGVSWQIVPANVEELLSRPGAFERMLQMKKLVIADY